MESNASLRHNHEKLVNLYHEHLQTVRSLQRTVVDDIVPGILDELELGSDAAEWAREWADDTGSVFRMFKRHKFTVPFTLEAIRMTILWRISYFLRPSMTTITSLEFLRCLPPPAFDPLHRPIVALSLSGLSGSSESLKDTFMSALERLRIHLFQLSNAEQSSSPVLQCVLIVDVQKSTFDNSKLDLISWFLRDVNPRFPGILAAVYVVNYSWTHSAMWNIIRPMLPKSVLSRVFFPSRSELLACIPSTSLPLDYGGTLPSLHDLEDHLSSIPPPPPIHSAIPISTMSAPSRHLSVAPQHTTLSPRSLLNPFFGYPVTASLAYNVPTLHHGRRRKRDLARTLVFLWWERWRDRVTIGMWFLLFWIAMKLWKAVRVDGRGRVLIGPV